MNEKGILSMGVRKQDPGPGEVWVTPSLPLTPAWNRAPCHRPLGRVGRQQRSQPVSLHFELARRRWCDTVCGWCHVRIFGRYPHTPTPRRPAGRS